MTETSRSLIRTTPSRKAATCRICGALSLAIATACSSLNAQSFGPGPESGRRPIDERTKSTLPHSERAIDGGFSRFVELPVHVKDNGGTPVAGARVKPIGLGFVERNASGFWNDGLPGVSHAAFSDQQGIATIRYPARVEGSAHGGHGWFTTRTVFIQVAHLDFIVQIVRFELGPPAAQVTLEPGCEVQLSAVDDRGEAISDFGVVMAGPFASDLWTSDGQGGKRTRSIPSGKWQTMLVKLRDDGRTLFSGVLPLPVRPSQAVKIRNVELSPGARILGRLSNEVPRPIRNGRIVSAVVPKPAAASHVREDPSLLWYQSATIDERGEFELPSVPRGGQLQIIAICDGWISKTGTGDAGDQVVMGQMFDVFGEKLSVVIDMERAGSLAVAVVAPGGGPLEGAKITAWPQQRFYKGNLAILGICFDSMRFIANQSLPFEGQTAKEEVHAALDRFTAVTDPTGKATIQGIPVGSNQSLTLTHPDYRLPLKNGEAAQPFKLGGPESQTLRIVVEAAPKAPSVER